jgi:hypothetical protein
MSTSRMPRNSNQLGLRERRPKHPCTDGMASRHAKSGRPRNRDRFPGPRRSHGCIRPGSNRLRDSLLLQHRSSRDFRFKIVLGKLLWWRLSRTIGSFSWHRPRLLPLRKIAFYVHMVLGLSIGLLASITCLTGSLIVLYAGDREPDPWAGSLILFRPRIVEPCRCSSPSMK